MAKFFKSKKKQKDDQIHSLGISTRPLPETPSCDDWIIEQQEKVLKQFSVMLKKNLSFNDTYILDYLEQDGTLSHTDVEAIKHGLRKEQVDKLLNTIRSKGPEAFDSFVNSLRDDYKHLFEKLYYFKSVKLQNQASATVDDALSVNTEEDESQEEDGYESSPFTLSSVNPLDISEENPSCFVRYSVQGYVCKTSGIDELHSRLFKRFKGRLPPPIPRLPTPKDSNYEDLPITKPINTNNVVKIENSEGENNSNNNIDDQTKVKQIEAVSEVMIVNDNPEEIERKNGDNEKSKLQESIASVVKKESMTKEENCNQVLEEIQCYNKELQMLLMEYINTDNMTLLTEGCNVIMNYRLSKLLWDASEKRYHCFIYTKEADLLLLRCDGVQKIGDPTGENWFFPVNVSSLQIERLLSETKEKGCFYVYKSTKSNMEIPFNLSLCSSVNGDVIHYHIEKNPLGYTISKDPESIKFQNIHALVHYFRNNRGTMACKLKWSPRDLKLFKPKYPKELEIKSEEVTILDKNNPRKSLAEHSYNNVFKGKFQETNVVVKTPAASEISRNTEDDFLSVARLLYEIEHESIEKIKGIFFVNAKPHMLFDCNEDCTLLEYSKKQDGMEPLKVLQIFAQVLTALVYLESKKFVIHRDIAARNCTIKEDTENNCKVKLGEFGMAVKVVFHDEYVAGSDSSYSYRWAAPEVIRYGKFSTKSDIWAAGLLFWEVSNGGKMPFDNLKTNEEVANVIKNRRAHLPIPESHAAFTRVFEQVVHPCWKYFADERPTAERLKQITQQTIENVSQSDLYDPLYGFCIQDNGEDEVHDIHSDTHSESDAPQKSPTTKNPLQRMKKMLQKEKKPSGSVFHVGAT